MAAYIQKRKTWPSGEEVRLPGLVLLWNIVEAQVGNRYYTALITLGGGWVWVSQCFMFSFGLGGRYYCHRK